MVNDLWSMTNTSLSYQQATSFGLTRDYFQQSVTIRFWRKKVNFREWFWYSSIRKLFSEWYRSDPKLSRRHGLGWWSTKIKSCLGHFVERIRTKPIRRHVQPNASSIQNICNTTWNTIWRLEPFTNKKIGPSQILVFLMKNIRSPSLAKKLQLFYRES